MIENASIVNDTRKVRCIISKKFNNDPDQYIEYLISLKNKCKPIIDKKQAIGIGTPITERPSHSTGHTDRVSGGLADQSRRR